MFDHLKEGDTVFVTWNQRHNQNRYYTVAKVGRKWVTLVGRTGRFEKETGLLDGGIYTSPGRAWLSKEAYDASCRVERKWSLFRRTVSGHTVKPNHIGEADLDNLLQLMGVKDE